MSQPFDVVYFAGAGGSSEAYRLALGKHPDVALNHNSTALAVHQLNFPETEHMVADVFDVDPRHIRPGVKWRSFWASPDCRHFSKAKGGAPVSPRIRGLAWIVVKVAKLLGDDAPDVIFLENVEEFRDWGPLIEDAEGKFKPDPSRKGVTFDLWKSRLEQCGYEVQHRELIAADYGAPTTRKRLFLIARRDGQPIVWPEKTHAPRKIAAAQGLKPYVPAADIIDWSLPCPSIFLTQAECKAMGIKAKRPLEEATLQRIAKGTLRYVIGAAEPFIAPLTHRGEGRFYDVNDPLRTIHAQGGNHALLAAHLDYAYGSNGGAAAGDPRDAIKAITGQGGHHGLIQHELAPAAGLDEKLHAFLIKYYGAADAADIADPLHSVTSRARFGLVIVRGEVWRIVDIGMRMLTPDELKGAQGFGRHYITNRDAFGRHVTKTNETLLIGNSVSPINGAALIAANLPPIEPARAAA